MLAVPIDNLGENPVVSDYFGKSKWFAIVDEGIISFEKNKHKTGCAIADWLYDLGVTQTIINHIGINPLLKLKELDIECLYSSDEVHSLVEVFEKLENHTLNSVNEKNMDLVVDPLKGCNEIC